MNKTSLRIWEDRSYKKEMLVTKNNNLRLLSGYQIFVRLVLLVSRLGFGSCRLVKAGVEVVGWLVETRSPVYVLQQGIV